MASPTQPPSLRLWTPVEQIGGLSGIQPELLPPGCLCQVLAASALYEWRRSSTAVADGVLVVANAKGSGSGRWHKLTNVLTLPGGTVLVLGTIPDGAALYRDGTEINGAPGSAAGEPLVYNPALPGWERVGASVVGIDNQGKPLVNFRNYRGDVTLVGSGGGSVALNLNGAVASVPMPVADVLQPLGFRVHWWQDVSPLVEQWMDDLIVSAYRSAAGLVILSDMGGISASGAGSATLALTGGSLATYSLSLNVGTGLVTLAMNQDAADNRRAIVTSWNGDVVPVTVTP